MTDLVGKGSATPTVGTWDHPLVDPNLEDAAITSRVPKLLRQRLRLKSWQYMTAVSDDLFLAFVVGTAGFASNGFVYAAELPGKRVHQKFAIVPLTVGTRLAPSSATGGHQLTTRDLTVRIDNLDAGRRFAARIEARTEGGGQLAAELAFSSAPADEHLAVCVPLPGGRWSYTHKFAAFAVTGSVTLDDRRIELAPGRSFGTLDFTKQYALRHSVWRWVSLCGRSKQGAIIGLNLVDPTPLAPVSENALWVDGKREPIADVHLDPSGETSWSVQGETVDLTMSELTHVAQKLDVPLVKNDLRHTIGAFSGRVRTRSGHVHDLANVVGIAEYFDSWW